MSRSFADYPFQPRYRKREGVAVDGAHGPQPLEPSRQSLKSMANEIIAYLDMCAREKVSLQRGMNFGLGNNHSVILMSLRANAPYDDRLEEEGSAVIYEGHDALRTKDGPDPKTADQPEFSENGRLTQNGLFHKAAQEFKTGRRSPERVRIYEKLRQGIWSYNGVFHLVDSWREMSNGRNVFKFRLAAVEGEEDFNVPPPRESTRRRVIPTPIKLEVWKRDGGQCVMCGATDELHFDHVLPFSRGGTSMVSENVQLLCARHNLAKHDRIE